MSGPALLILDVDDTLTRSAVRGRPPNHPEEQLLIPGVFERVQAQLGVGEIALATNQGGVAMGFMSVVEHRALMSALRRQLEVPADRFRVFACYHPPRGRCGCRKPRPGLLNMALAAWGVAPADALMVGDRLTDLKAAKAAGVAFVFAKEWNPEGVVGG